MTPRRPSWLYATEPGRQVVALGSALLLTAVAVDHLLSERLSLFFDLSFITFCLFLAFRVEEADLHLGAVLPPLLMLGVLVLLAVVAPGTVAREHDGVVQAVVTGLTHHSAALVAGWSLALLAFEGRRRGLVTGWEPRER